MDVYVVYEPDTVEDNYIYGIFSSKEEAETLMEHYPFPKSMEIVDIPLDVFKCGDFVSMYRYSHILGGNISVEKMPDKHIDVKDLQSFVNMDVQEGIIEIWGNLLSNNKDNALEKAEKAVEEFNKPDAEWRCSAKQVLIDGFILSTMRMKDVIQFLNDNKDNLDDKIIEMTKSEANSILRFARNSAHLYEQFTGMPHTPSELEMARLARECGKLLWG